VQQPVGQAWLRPDALPLRLRQGEILGDPAELGAESGCRCHQLAGVLIHLHRVCGTGRQRRQKLPHVQPASTREARGLMQPAHRAGDGVGNDQRWRG
jgi:hypothetical protein